MNSSYLTGQTELAFPLICSICGSQDGIYVGKKTLCSNCYEKYTRKHRPWLTYFPLRYQVLPRFFRYWYQKFLSNSELFKNSFPSWPYEEDFESSRSLFLKNFSYRKEADDFKKINWGENKQYCLVLTHDVEALDNWKWVRATAEAEMELGLRSSWNIVPKLYKIDYSLLDWLIANGFEVGMHGYDHNLRLPFF